MAFRRVALGVLLATGAACPPALGDAPPLGAVLSERKLAAPERASERRSAPLARDIEQRLSTLQSRTTSSSLDPIQRRQAERDLEVNEQRLRTLKTMSPQAAQIPALERRLDRVRRPLDPLRGRTMGLDLGRPIGGYDR